LVVDFSGAVVSALFFWTIFFFALIMDTLLDSLSSSLFH
jgi:hypothetical protein